MANLITHKRSSVASAVPAPSQLALGELAINTTDKLLFIKDGTNTVVALNNTSNIVEGSNLFFTDARARQAISVIDNAGDGTLSYDNVTGVLTYAGISDAQIRSKFTATGDLNYNSATGEFSVNIPDPDIQWSDVSSATTVSSTKAGVAADTSGGVFTLTLPATPSVGDYVVIVDATTSFNTNNLTIDGNGNNIMGSASLVLSTDDYFATYTYLGAVGWRQTS